MSDSNRRDFVKITGLVFIGTAVLPRIPLLGSQIKKLPSYDGYIPPIRDVSAPDVFGVIDMHAHPSQKLYLLDNLFWRRFHFPRKRGDNFLHEQIDEYQLQKNEVVTSGGKTKRRVMGMITAHYLPEMTTVKDKNLLHLLYSVLNWIPWSSLAQKMENEDMTNYVQLNLMMDQLEIQVNKTNRKLGFELIRIVKSYKEFDDAKKAGIIPFAHSVEGSHSLGRIKANGPHRRAAYIAQLGEKNYLNNPSIASDLTQAKEQAYANSLANSLGHSVTVKPGEVDEQIQKWGPITTDGPITFEDDGLIKLLGRLDELKERGVCLITLAHFFSNDIIRTPVIGISADSAGSMNIDLPYSSSDENQLEHELSISGAVIVRKMLEIGIIVDLTHTNPCAREQIFNINDERGSKKRPIVFSHSGVRKIFDKYCPDKYSVYHNRPAADFGDYNATDEEICRINDCQGVIAIIPEVFWLTGCDIHWCMDIKHSRKHRGLGPLNFHNGIRFMLESIEHIFSLTGTFDNVAIGSDFDGLADASRNLALPSQFGNFTVALEKELILLKVKYGNAFPSKPINDIITDITSGNALRVLQLGWV